MALVKGVTACQVDFFSRRNLAGKSGIPVTTMLPWWLRVTEAMTGLVIPCSVKVLLNAFLRVRGSIFSFVSLIRTIWRSLRGSWVGDLEVAFLGGTVCQPWFGGSPCPTAAA